MKSPSSSFVPPRALLTALLATALFSAAACGTVVDIDTGSANAPTSEPATPTASTGSSPDLEPDPDRETDPAPEPTTAPTAVAAEPSTPTASQVAGMVYVDPDGQWQLTIPEDWGDADLELVPNAVLWAVGPPASNFRPNVNVTTETIPNMGLADYLNLSLENAPDFFDDFELVSEELVEGLNGDQLAVWEYTGGGLSFMGVIGVNNSLAVVATFSATPESYADLRDEVLPHLLTVEPLN